MNLNFTLVVYPIDRADQWSWISGAGAPKLSSDGSEPATHRWFSIIPTASEASEIDSTLTADDTKLTVDLDTQSPQAVIEAATGLKPFGPEE